MNAVQLVEGNVRFTREVSACRSDRYTITVQPYGLDSWPDLLENICGIRATRYWVVSDTAVLAHLGNRFLAAPRAKDLVQDVLKITPGEASKSVPTWMRLLDWLGDRGARRRDVVLALGGSVVSDVAGFAAASFMRGIRYVNLPTSFLSQVDGAVGGKVAVNASWAKNVIGAFHHPAAVLIDPTALATLPRIEIANGIAEVIKSFVISPGADFDALVERIPDCLAGNLDALRWAVTNAVTQKMDLVDPDPYEHDLNRVLNFGHTLGHAIEAFDGYQNIRHGMAVAIGIACATRLGVARGLTSPTTATRIFEALDLAGLPDRLDVQDATGVVRNVGAIAAIRNGSLRFVVPRTFGHMEILDDLTSEEIVKAAIG